MECLPDVESTCRLCVGQQQTELTSIQPYIGILCKLGEFSLDPHLPQKVCGKCLPLLDIAESLRRSIADIEPFWSQCLTMKREVILSPEPEQELQIWDVRGAVDYSRNDSTTIHGLLPGIQEEWVKVEHQTTDDEESADLEDMSPHELSADEDNLEIDGQEEYFEDLAFVPKYVVDYEKEYQRENAANDTEGRLTFPCPICSYVSSWRGNLQAHVRNKHPEQSVCLKCLQNFKKPSEFSAHKIICSNRVKCCICRAECANATDYQLHLATVHQKKTFVCDYEGCGHVFHKRRNLISHKHTHSTVKEFICSYEGCGAAFNQKRALNSHVRFKHTREKTYGCRYCQKMFCQAGGRNRHQINCKNNR